MDVTNLVSLDVTNLVSILFIVIYLVPNNVIDICRSALVNSFLRTIVHANIAHLAINLASFRNISNALIAKLSTKMYVQILILLWILDGLSDYFSISAGIKMCSVGFSGVIFGLVTYYFLEASNDYMFVVSQLLLLLVPGLLIPGISNFGHMLGILNGFIVKMFV